MSKMEKWSPGQLQQIEPYEFEKLLAQLFRKMGYVVEETQYSHDRGIDLIIRIVHFGLSHSWIVQAKRYTEPVGVKAVREYSSLRYRDRVDGVIIVATSSFTREGQDEAAEHNVKLIDVNLLVEMLNHYLPEENRGLCTKEATESGDVRSNESFTIMRRGEELLAEEPVSLGKEKMVMVITSKNIFFKKESGLISRKENIEQRIEMKDMAGVHADQQGLFLIAGQKRLKVYPLSVKRKDRILELLESLRPEYVRGEHLLKSARKNSTMTILTNKRLAQIGIDNGGMEDIPLSKIISVEADSGFFKKDRIIVSESSNGVEKHFFEVDNAQEWKAVIEQKVRAG
jgi:restriction system protein